MAKRIPVPEVESVEDLEPPPPTDSVQRAVWLLEYFRARGFRTTALRIGDVMCNVQDIRQAKLEGYEEQTKVEDGPSIWQEAGMQEPE